jgi:hypothetical protein
MIRKAIRKSRGSRPKKKLVGETVRLQVAIDATPGSPTTGETAGVQAEAASELAASIVEGRQSPTQGHQAQSLSKIFTVVPDNGVLVHKLPIDKKYRINASPTAGIRDKLNRELCNAMLKGFQEGNSTN